jgi:hypothetical protein
MQFSTMKPPAPTNDPNDHWTQAERGISENTFSPFALEAFLRAGNGLYIYDATQGDSARIYYGTQLTQG